MKHSHLITPRTLADCEFRSGYYSAQPSQVPRTRWWHVAIMLAAFAGIGVMLAWRG